MRSRILALSGVTAAAVIAAVSFAGQANAGTSPSVHQGVASHVAAPAAKAPCYSGNTGDTGTGVISTQTDDPAANTSAGAVDFTVTKKCTIDTVYATGVYAAGSGPASSVTVTFYKNQKKTGLPGKVVNTQTASGSLASPAFTLTINPVKLKKGSYWVSVQASMDYAQVGGWFWELSSTLQGGPSAWENPGGGYGLCPTWTLLTGCQGFDNDFMVELAK